MSDSKLRKILQAGRVLPQTDEAIAILAQGLDRAAVLYGMMSIRSKAPQSASLKNKLKKLQRSAQKIGKILDDDFDTGSGLEGLLSGFELPMSQETREWLRTLAAEGVPDALVDKALLAIHHFDANYRPPRHGETPDTWLFLALHDLFELINHGTPPKSYELEAFADKAVEYLKLEIKVPWGKAFENRVRRALERRGTEKTNLLPRPVVGTWTPR